ncbi:MAG: 4-hydroxy-tetrahydrodipicolinate synthase [Alphaproteobacteria bacterium]|nr:4-hydroxy-tetrahydrodipicolinate synthase [Alphaproteobacteria bacterium]
MFRGSMTALVTPFNKDGSLDTDSYIKFINWQIINGTEGIIPCGTTGEVPTLSDDEQEQVIAIAVAQAKGKVSVIAGTGTNSTARTIKSTQKAKKLGADAALIVTPYYNKPTQEGLYQHYKAIHDAVDLPIIIYNNPARCVVDMSVDTMARLAELKNIVGVKDASGDITRPLKTKMKIKKTFNQLSGEDALVVPFLAQGGAGCISVTANIAPKLCADLHKAWRAGNYEKVAALNAQLMPLHDAMFCETNPGPVKYAAELLGLCSALTRPPLWTISDASKEIVKTALKNTGLIA